MLCALTNERHVSPYSRKVLFQVHFKTPSESTQHLNLTANCTTTSRSKCHSIKTLARLLFFHNRCHYYCRTLHNYFNHSVTKCISFGACRHRAVGPLRDLQNHVKPPTIPVIAEIICKSLSLKCQPADQSIRTILLKTLTLCSPTCVIAVFLKQKIGFKTSYILNDPLKVPFVLFFFSQAPL